MTVSKANLGCQLSWIWSQLRCKPQGTPMRGFPAWVNWTGKAHLCGQHHPVVTAQVRGSSRSRLNLSCHLLASDVRQQCIFLVAVTLSQTPSFTNFGTSLLWPSSVDGNQWLYRNLLGIQSYMDWEATRSQSLQGKMTFVALPRPI